MSIRAKMRLNKLTLDAWKALDHQGRLNVHSELAKVIAVDSSWIFFDENSIVFQECRSKLNFRFIFSHEASFGFSEDEYLAADSISSPIQANVDEMRPFQRVMVPAFLIAEEPLRNSSPLLIDGNFKDLPPQFPAYIDFDEGANACAKIGALPPSELQLEAAVRSGRDSLFCFGDKLPRTEELEIWLTHDLNKSSKYRNDFGLYGLFFPEWTRDEFRDSHAITAIAVEGSKVIKGGGAYFWPWQDDEWVWCMSAMRMPSCDLIENQAVVRPVIQLP